MRKVFFILSLLLGLIFIAGCASKNDAYLKVTKENSIKGYEHFLKKHPHDPNAEDARKRLDALKEEKDFPEVEATNSTAAYTAFYQRFPDGKFAEEAKKRASASDRDAFMTTCGLGTVKAFYGFMESYPSSRYYSLAAARINFLNVATPGSLAAFMQFITTDPGNPFVVEASASYPLLWLDRAGEKVGVIIEVGEFVSWKGLIHGRRTTKSEVRQKTFKALEKEVGKYGISLTLLEKPEDAKDAGIPVILDMKYSEKELIAESLAKAIGDYFTGPTLILSPVMTIKDATSGFEYYSKISDLKAKVDRAVTIKALSGINEKSTLSSLIVSLYDQDPAIQNSAAEALKKITGQDFKEDRAKWYELWEGENP